MALVYDTRRLETKLFIQVGGEGWLLRPSPKLTSIVSTSSSAEGEEGDEAAFEEVPASLLAIEELAEDAYDHAFVAAYAEVRSAAQALASGLKAFRATWKTPPSIRGPDAGRRNSARLCGVSIGNFSWVFVPTG